MVWGRCGFIQAGYPQCRREKRLHLSGLHGKTQSEIYFLDKCNSSMASIRLVQHIWYVLHVKKLKHVAHTFLLDESDLQDWTNQLRDEVGPLAIQAAPHLKHGLGH